MTGVKAVVLEDVVELDKVGHVESDSGPGLEDGLAVVDGIRGG